MGLALKDILSKPSATSDISSDQQKHGGKQSSKKNEKIGSLHKCLFRMV